MISIDEECEKNILNEWEARTKRKLYTNRTVSDKRANFRLRAKDDSRPFVEPSAAKMITAFLAKRKWKFIRKSVLVSEGIGGLMMIKNREHFQTHIRSYIRIYVYEYKVNGREKNAFNAQLLFHLNKRAIRAFCVQNVNAHFGPCMSVWIYIRIFSSQPTFSHTLRLSSYTQCNFLLRIVRFTIA